MTPWLKRFILEEIDRKNLTEEAAIRLYDLSKEELNYWGSAYQKIGAEGLKIKNRKRILS